MNMADQLIVIETHPIQYHAPVYRILQQEFGVPVTAVYGSDFSVAGYHDTEFDTTFAWDTDLLAGYTSVFLSRTSTGGPGTAEATTAEGLGSLLPSLSPAALLLTGYSPRFYRQTLKQVWRAGIPLFFRGETTDHGRDRSLLKRTARDFMLRRLYRRCAALLYIGRHAGDHYRRLGGTSQQLIFSPYGIDITPFDADEDGRNRLRAVNRKALCLADDQYGVLFSGKLIPRKAPEQLLEAVKNLPAAMRDRMVLIFLGDGALKPALQRAAQSEPVVQVRFAGFQQQGDLSRYYQAADMLVLPSRYETWGLVVNEALHHGLPCVVSDQVGCAVDLIQPGRTGEIFALEDGTALGAAIQRATALAGRVDVRQYCRHHIEGYTLHKAAAGIAEAYHRIQKADSL